MVHENFPSSLPDALPTSDLAIDSAAEQAHPPAGEFDDCPLPDDDLQAAKAAWESADLIAPSDLISEGEAIDPVTAPYVGRWNRLVSFTNWEKGRIIGQWRQAMIESGAAVTEYSDETWARSVGGVTASHVGRLRRVHDAFADTHESYPGLSWTHFLAALDWDDAPMWLEGAAQSRWSVSAMRRQRWQVVDGDETNRPQSADELSPPWDEDFVDPNSLNPSAAAGGTTPAMTQPAQGGGSTRKYEEGPEAIGSGPRVEGPDFGDEESLNRIGTDFPGGPKPADFPADGASAEPLIQPFAGLPELPNDLADAVELLKLALLRHKTGGWRETTPSIIRQYLAAFEKLIEAPKG